MKNFKNIISISLSSILIAFSSFADTNRAINFKKNTNSDSYKNLEDNIEGIFTNVQSIRNLKTKKPITVGIKNTKELNTFLRKTFKDEYSDKDMRKDYLSLLHFGLIKKNTNLKETFLNLYTEQIAGFYDNHTKELYVIDNPKISSLESSIVISHELTHALQDQYFDLTKFIKDQTNQDMALARLSLIEGEAMLSSIEYMSKSIISKGLGAFSMVADLLKNPLGGSFSSDALSKTPGFLVEQMTFPYIQGMEFTSFVKNQFGGWEGLAKVYSNPPLSTEQIIHPEKYISGEKPIEVNIDEKFFKDKKYSFIKKDTLGEFFLFNYFLEYLGEDESKEASSGWGGDKSVIFSDKNDNTIMVYKSSWDTTKDANEFFESYKNSIKSRFKSSLSSIKETKTTFTSKTDKGLVYIILKNNTVNIAEGFDSNNQKIFLKYLN